MHTSVLYCTIHISIFTLNIIFSCLKVYSVRKAVSTATTREKYCSSTHLPFVKFGACWSSNWKGRAGNPTWATSCVSSTITRSLPTQFYVFPIYCCFYLFYILPLLYFPILFPPDASLMWFVCLCLKSF